MGDHIENLIKLLYCRWENLATHAQCGASLSRSNIAMTDPMCDPCIHIFAIAMIDQSYVGHSASNTHSVCVTHEYGPTGCSFKISF